MASDQKDLTDAAEQLMADKHIGDEDTRQSPAEGALVIDEITLDESDSQVPPSEQSALAELRATGKPLSPDRMHAAIREFFDKQAASRKLLRAMMTEGVHYGYPPKTAPTIVQTKDGPMYKVSTKDKKTGKWSDELVSPKAYTRRESLYKPGAEIICDLFGARAEYTLTSEGEKVIVLCRLYAADGTLRGEGHGADASKYDQNKAVKMAEKRALVNAVLDTFHLSDLFTQDLEDLVVEPYKAPAQTKGAPNVPPRGETPPAVGRPEILVNAKNWQQVHDPNKLLSKEDAWERYAEWMRITTGREFDSKTVWREEFWTVEDLAKCKAVWEAMP